MQVLFLATAWGAKHGGLNAFNHDLAVAVATRLGPGRVFCATPSPLRLEVAAAAAAGVTLIPILEGRGGSRFEDAWVGQLIEDLASLGLSSRELGWVGHDLISGAAAIEGARSGGRSCVLMHMDYEAYKAPQGADGASVIARHEEQRRLFEAADHAFAVGPLLASRCRDMRPNKSVVTLIPGFASIPSRALPTSRLSAITFGRFDDETVRLKQWRLALAGFAAAARGGGTTETDHLLATATLRVIGLDESVDLDGLKTEAEAISGRMLDVIPQGFIEDPADLRRQLRSSNLAMMLSWHEGFGLTGWEAIGCEVPLILGRNSGLYRLIEEQLGSGGEDCVSVLSIEGATSRTGFTDRDQASVARAIRRTAETLTDAMANARRLRANLEGALDGATWDRTAVAFLDALEAEPSAHGGGTPSPSTAQRPRVARFSYLPDCVELTVSTTQGSRPESFDLLSELRFGRALGEHDEFAIEYGVTEALVTLATYGCAPLGGRLGDDQTLTHLISEAGKWRVVGPHDGIGALCREAFGGEVLCRLEAQGAEESPPSATLIVTSHRTHVRYKVLWPEGAAVALTPSRKAIVDAFLNRCHLQPGGVFEIARSSMTWPAEP